MKMCLKINPLDKLVVLTWRLPQVPTNDFECFSRILEREKTVVLENLAALVEENSLFFLQTCQRIILAFIAEKTEDKFRVLQVLARSLELESILSSREEFIGEQGFFHLAEVTSSLHSLVLGEPQVLGQVKKARDDLVAKGLLKGALKIVLDHAVNAAALIMSTTSIPRGKVSTISLVEDVIKKYLSRCLNHDKIPSMGIFGTGEMATESFKLIKRFNVPIDVTWYTHREELLTSPTFTGDHPIKNALEFYYDPEPHDILILATVHEFPFFDDDLARKYLENYMTTQCNIIKPLVIDLGMPRCSLPSVKEIEELTLIQMEDLFSETKENQRKREQARQESKVIIRQQVIGLRKKLLYYAKRDLLQVMRSDLIQKWENRKKQLDKLLNQKDVDADRLELVVERIMKDFMHVSLTHVKRMLWEVDQADSRGRQRE